MNPVRTSAGRTIPSGISSARRRRRPVLPAGAVATATVPLPTTVDIPSRPNIQARVIAAIAAALGLVLVSTIGLRMLRSEPPPPEPTAVLPPADVFLVHQAKELERERAQVKKLATELEALRALNHKTASDLKNKEERIQEKEVQLRERDEWLRKAELEASSSAKQLRAVKNELAEKDSQLREKLGELSQLQASLKTYEDAKRELERQKRELETQLAKLKKPARRESAGLTADWPAFFQNDVVFRTQARDLKSLLEKLEKETDPDLRAYRLRQVGQLADELKGGLDKRSDLEARDAAFFLSDTLVPRLIMFKRQMQ